MGNSSRTTNIKTLEQQHRALADEVARLEKRAFLTPSEQLEVSNLKKRKLAAKDQLFDIRRP
jgi:uncharacterized protein YdcH (DUF465 family)